MAKICFQGTIGAYSQEAIYKYFGEKCEVYGKEFSEQVIDELLNKNCDLVVLPIENSIVGNVNINLDLLYSKNINAIGEIYIPIRHCLLARPGVKLEDIKVVKSHPIALAQCQKFLKEHNIRMISEYDTAGASKKLSESEKKNEGTISSKLCSSHYNLDIIKEDVQDVKTNITRFLVIQRSTDVQENPKADKTTMAFKVKHHPGALVNCLNTFSHFGINLTKLESRPVPEDPFKYAFIVDFTGTTGEKKVSSCLEFLGNDAFDIKIIGTYSEGLRDFALSEVKSSGPTSHQEKLNNEENSKTDI